MISINDFLGEAEGVDVSLKTTKEDLHSPKVNFKIDSKAVDKAKDAFSTASKRQKEYIKNYEDDEKRYKALKKYGEVLQLVEKLLGLIPGDLSNLSTKELEQKLEDLLKTRKRNEQQIIFTFYQNLITDILTNLVSIEKSTQQGTISPAEALTEVRNLKQQFTISHNEMPSTLHIVLGQPMEEASYLLDIYEKTFNAEQQLTSSGNGINLLTTDLNTRHEVLFSKLNLDTKALMNQVGSLSSDLNNFESHVDLTKLTQCLKSTDEVLQKEDWKASDLNVAVSDLKSTTVSLTDKQVQLNQTNEKLEAEIKDCTEKASEFTEISMLEISRETFKEMTERAEQTNEIAEDTVAILENDENLNTTLGSQIAETISGQMDADVRVGDKLAADPNASVVTRSIETTNEAADVAVELKNSVLTLEQQRQLMLQLELKKEADENNQK